MNKVKNEITVFDGKENLGSLHSFEYEKLSKQRPLRVYFGPGEDAKLLGAISPERYDLLFNGKFEGSLVKHKNLPSQIQIIPAKSQKARIIGILQSEGVAINKNLKKEYKILEPKDEAKKPYTEIEGGTNLRALIIKAANAYGVSIAYTSVSGLVKTLTKHPVLSHAFQFLNTSFQEELLDMIFEPQFLWAINRGVAFTEHKASKWKKINGGKALSRQERIAYAVAYFYTEIVKAEANGKIEDYSEFAKKAAKYLDTTLQNQTNFKRFYQYINTTLS